jgi:hypothetical protein
LPKSGAWEKLHVLAAYRKLAHAREEVSSCRRHVVYTRSMSKESSSFFLVSESATKKQQQYIVQYSEYDSVHNEWICTSKTTINSKISTAAEHKLFNSTPANTTHKKH